MKIMFNIMGLGKGGAERVINILANSLCQSNDIYILTNINSNVEYKFNKKVAIDSLVNSRNTFLRKIRRFSPFMICKLKNKILSYNPDIIISFLPEPSFRLLFLKKISKKIKNIPTIVSVRNDPNTEYKKNIYFQVMKRLYPLTDELVLQTNDSKKYFIEKINYSGIVIPNPVSDSFLTERYLGKREKNIVAVGRLEPQKNYINMINAFEIVSKKFKEYKFNIYGDGFMKDELQSYIEKKGLEEIIILNGKVDNVKEKIYKASAFVMASDYEGMPNSLLEAACLGVPCISTDCPCGGPRDILNNGKNGILVKTNNSKDLAMGIVKVLSDNNLANRLSEKSNNNAQKYNKDVIIAEWYDLIQKLVKKISNIILLFYFVKISL